MATSNYGYIGAGGVQAVQSGIQKVLSDRAEAQALAFEQWVKEQDLQAKFDDIGLRRDQFNEKTRGDNLERPSTIALRVAQANDLDRKPGESVLAHQRRLEELGVTHTNKLAEITHTGDIDSRQLGEAAGYESGHISQRTAGQIANTRAAGDEARKTDAADPAKAGGTTHMSNADSTKLDDLNSLETLIGEIDELGRKTNWSAVGGAGIGKGKAFLATHLGTGTAEEQSLRNKMGNLLGSVAAARAGLTFTAGEKELLDSYVANIGQSPMVAMQKNKDMLQWARQRRSSIAARYARPDLNTNPQSAAQDVVITRGADGKLALPSSAAPAAASTGTAWVTGPDGRAVRQRE